MSQPAAPPAATVENSFEPFAAFLAQVAASDSLPDKIAPCDVALAFANHLVTIDPAKLPKAAQPQWHRLVTRLLKVASGQRPLPQRAIAGIASWPSARVAELLALVTAIEAEIARAANDRLIDETNERVSRAYL